MKQFVRRVWEVYKPLRLPMLGIFGFIILSQAMNLASPYLQSRVIDGLIKKEPDLSVYLFAVIAFALWLFRATVFQWARDRYELAYIDFAIPERMREVTFTRLLGFSIGQHISENSGIKQSVVSRGENALVNLGDLVLYQVSPLVAEVSLLTGVLLYWSRPIGFIVLFTVVLYAISAISINLYFKKDIKEVDRLYVRDSKFQGEVMKNIPLVIATAQEERALRECKESFCGANLFAKKLWTRFVILASFRNAIPIIARFAVLVVGIRFVISGQHTIGEFVMLLSWTINAVGKLSDMSPMQRQLIKAYVSVRRYFEMLDIEPDVKTLPNPVRPERFKGRIEFKNVTFRYRGRDESDEVPDDEEDEAPVTARDCPVGPALDNVSFVIEEGQKVAFVGESGAGKSSLVGALIRAQDLESGQIIVDGNDTRVLDLKHFRESIGIVDQDVSLFDNTLRYNIAYGMGERFSGVSDRELRIAAEMSCIDRFFHRLERGFDTLIGERGIKLSGGERQRVGIARALIKEPDILIFDEATSNLDSENEALIRESIEKVSRGRTTLIIAHRFSTIRKVDKVIVLEKGRVVGEGTHEWLAEHCEPYQRLMQNQMM